ncbi:MAG: PAS domain S-box protein, partial [Anaerolineae bacterium]
SRDASGESLDVEYRVLTRDGRVLWFRNKATLVRDETGRIRFSHGVMLDITERKQAEEALRESEERYKILFESTLDGMCVIDKTMKILLVNQAAANIFGFDSVEEVFGVNPFDFIPPEERERVLTIVTKDMFENDLRQVNEFRLINKAGEEVWISAVGTLIQYKGELAGLVSFRDITERKKAEEALAHERDLLRALMDNVPDSIYFKDTSGRFTRINMAQAQILGVRDPKEAVGKTDFDFFTEEHARDAYIDEQEIVKSGQPLIDKVEKIRRADGEFRWVSATKVPIKNEEGQVTGIVGISRDITDRVWADQEIHRLNQFLESIIDNANIWLNVLDEKLNVVFWNKAAEEISGYSRGEVIGHDKIWEWLYPDEEYRKEVTAKAAAIIERGETEEDSETRIQCKDGQTRIISWNSRRLLDEKGAPIGS